ncbi:MAG: T9SS type A sorting domain-containing protein, partial [Bacteroidales bacterium]
TVYAIFELTMDAGNNLGSPGQINIFPVPVVNVLNADIPTEEVYDVSIINNAGQVVFALGKATKGNIRFNLSSLKPGLYFIRFSSASDIVTRKFLKQ